MEELKKERDKILNRIGELIVAIEEFEGERTILSEEFIEINKQIVKAKEEEEEKKKKVAAERAELFEYGDLNCLNKEYRRLNRIIDRHRKGIDTTPLGSVHTQRRETFEKIEELENENIENNRRVF